MLPPPPPALTRLEEMVLDSVPFDPDTPSLDVQVERVRVWLRSEIEKRLRNAAQRERVEVNCRSCGGVTDISVSHANKVLHGRVELPLCLDCRSPARTAEADAEVVAFVAALEDQADEFVGAIAALR